MRTLARLLCLVPFSMPVQAQSEVPNLVGTWACDPAPILIREDWTTLTYTIQITEQREGLFRGTFSWTLPEEHGVKGEKVNGEKSFKGEWTALGVVGWDNTTVEVVSYKSVQRHEGTLVDANTLRFVHSKIGDDAWVSRSVCKRQ